MKRLFLTLGAIIVYLAGFKLAYGASLESVINTAEPKVVKIGIVSDKGGGICSGAIIDKEGDVLTCAHCFIRGEVKKIFIKDSKEAVRMGVKVYIDHRRDLAIVSSKEPGVYPYFNLGKSPVRGQEVIAMGSPLGMQHSATTGFVNNIILQTFLFVIHSASINPGNSGGPLIDFKGRLIGINEATIHYGLFHLQRAEAVNIAIDITTVKDFLKEVKR